MSADFLQPEGTEAGCGGLIIVISGFFSIYKAMKGQYKNWIVLFLIVFFTKNIKADTIEYWHLYFNGHKIGECSRVSGPSTIVLKRTNIKENDSFVIAHFTDNYIQPDKKEWSWIEVYKEEDTLKRWVLTSDDDFTGGKIVVHFNRIIANSNPNKETYFKVYFIPGPIKNLTDKDRIPLFRFRIE